MLADSCYLKIPENADENFVREVAEQFKATTPPVRPFNQR